MEPFLGRLCLRRVDSLKVLREILGLHVSHDCLLVHRILISIYFQVIDYLWHTYGIWIIKVRNIHQCYQLYLFGFSIFYFFSLISLVIPHAIVVGGT